MEQIGRVGQISSNRPLATPTLQSNFHKVQFRGVGLNGKH